MCEFIPEIYQIIFFFPHAKNFYTIPIPPPKYYSIFHTRWKVSIIPLLHDTMFSMQAPTITYKFEHSRTHTSWATLLLCTHLSSLHSLHITPYTQNVTVSQECVDSVKQSTQTPSKILSLFSRKTPSTNYHKVIQNQCFVTEVINSSIQVPLPLA